ncbi:6690_t:CDS:1, partial [Racocetra persica]
HLSDDGDIRTTSGDVDKEKVLGMLSGGYFINQIIRADLS